MSDETHQDLPERIIASTIAQQTMVDANERILILMDRVMKRQQAAKDRVLEIEAKMDKLQAKIERIKKDWDTTN